jgi:hypothetical protein
MEKHFEFAMKAGIMFKNINEKLKDYEGVLRGVEILALIATLFTAIIIGIRQNDINQNLVDLNFFPSVEVVYDNNQIRILNHGEKDVFIGPMVFYDKFENVGKINVRDEDIRLITPNGFYYFSIELLDTTIDKYEKEIGRNGDAVIPFDVFLKSFEGKKYIVKNLLYIIFKDDAPDIRTQTLSIIKSNW